ncbi:MAG TPA: hypothetical protein VGM88_00200 [Kofleriaceae bacterium]|jgi:hypothetical protein
MRLLGVAALAVLVSCAHNVPQDSNTGKDGRPSGARPLALENGEGHLKGIVTYPGGDRVDWAVLELPKDTTGDLQLALTWQTPRPGLRLQFEVFDQYFQRVGLGKHEGRRARDAAVIDARGTYFVRVYAERRGDAGKYDLGATFKPAPPPPPKFVSLDVADPPKLPEVPAAAVACTAFDAANPSCLGECPLGAPAGWAGCDKSCQPGDPDLKPACLKVRPCPTAWDGRFADCIAHPPKCPKAHQDPLNGCADIAQPASGRILDIHVDGTHTVLQIGVGTDAAPGLTADWTAVLRDKSGKAIAGGSLVIVSVRKNSVIVTSSLTVDRIRDASASVTLTPPSH